MFTYFTEFYKQALYHFVVSAACSALFALGLEFSKGSDGKTNTPYFMPAMVLSAIHFILTVIAILAFYYARSLSEIYDGLSPWNNSEKHYRRLKPLYLLLLYPCFIWSIVGAAIAGQTGICSTDERPCYYTVNNWQNRTITIVIIVVHVLNGILTFFTMVTRHKIRRDVIDEADILRQRKKDKVLASLTLNSKPPTFGIKNKNHVKEAENDRRLKLPPIKGPLPLKKQISTVGMNSISGSKSRENDRNGQKHLPTILQPLKRRHTSCDDQIRSASHIAIEPQTGDQNEANIKPLSANKKDRKLLKTEKLISKLRIVAPRHRSASLIQPKGKTLYTDSDDSTLHSDESDIAVQTHSQSTKKLPVRRLTEHPRAPPPSYQQTTASVDTEPYWLPPPPQHDSNMHYLPENMYSGYSYPDTELLPAHPVKVPKAHWQIID